MTTEYIADRDHYVVIIEKIRNAKSMLWIGTADIKDLHISNGKNTEPYLGLLSRLLKTGVEIRSFTQKSRARHSAKTLTVIQT